MFSGKNRKNSIISLAVIAMLAIALLGFAKGNVPAAASTVTREDVYSLTGYVSGIAEAYEYDTQDFATEPSAEMAAVVEAATAYSGAATGDDGSIEASFERLSAYQALSAATDAYNLAHPEAYVLSITDGEYAPEKTYAAAIDGVVKSAEGWEEAYEGDYEISYEVSFNGEVILNVYALGYNGSFLVDPVAEGVEGVTPTRSANEVQAFTLDYEGCSYDFEIGFTKKTTVNETTLVTTVTYENVKIYTCNSQNGQANVGGFEVGNLVQQSKIKNIIAAAGDYFENVPAEDDAAAAKAKYDEFIAAVEEKINSIKNTAEKTLLSKFEKEYYEVAVFTQIENEVKALVDGGYEAFRKYVSPAAGEQTVNELVEEKGFVKYPEKFRTKYGEVLAANKIYTEEEQELAEAAYTVLEGLAEEIFVNLEVVKGELAEDGEVIFENLKLTAKKQIEEKAEQIIGDSTNYSSEQIREITKEYVSKRAEVDGAETLAEIEEIVNGFTLTVNGFEVETETKLVSGKVTVEIVGAKFSKGTTLEASFAELNEETIREVDSGKQGDVVTRRLTALLGLEIKLLDANGNYIDYATMGVTYKVTVAFDENDQNDQKTINVLSTEGVESSLKMLYLNGEGRPEVLEVEYTEGSIMFDTTHFSTYYLMGNTSNLAITKLTNLLGAINAETLMPVLIALGALVGVILLTILISFIVSLCLRYKIKFVSNGGTKVKKVAGRYGKNLPELPVPEREGYVFDGWCIDKSLKYEFNRTVMPRANTLLYARWITEEEYNERQTDAKKLILVSYYDKLRAKLASCKKPVKQGEKSFVKQEVLAKLYAEENQIRLFVKTKLDCIKEENGKAYIVADADKYESGIITDEISYNNAVEAINKMAVANGLIMAEEPTLSESTYNEAVLGYAYIINYEEIADFDERYCALRAYALGFEITDAEKAEPGKVLFELIPYDKETLDLGLALDLDKYGKILEEKTTAGELKSVYTITDGECMGVAFELIERVMNDNGFAKVETEAKVEEGEFNPEEAYQYIIEGVEEVVEEPAPVEEVVEEPAPVEEVVEEPVPELSLADLFTQFRCYVCSFAMFAEEGVIADRSNDGKVIVKAKLGAEAVEVTIDPECDAEAFLIATAAELEEAKEKVNAVMAKYGLEFNEAVEVENVVLAETEAFGYRIKFPAAKTVEQLFDELRDYTNGFAMFVEEGVEPDTSVDGTVVVNAALKDGVINVIVDPNAEAQVVTVADESELEAAKQAIATAMAKYGLEPDPDFVPAEERAQGEAFGFRVKF